LLVGQLLVEVGVLRLEVVEHLLCIAVFQPGVRVGGGFAAGDGGLAVGHGGSLAGQG